MSPDVVGSSKNFSGSSRYEFNLSTRFFTNGISELTVAAPEQTHSEIVCRSSIKHRIIIGHLFDDRCFLLRLTSLNNVNGPRSSFRPRHGPGTTPAMWRGQAQPSSRATPPRCDAASPSTSALRTADRLRGTGMRRFQMVGWDDDQGLSATVEAGPECLDQDSKLSRNLSRSAPSIIFFQFGCPVFNPLLGL